MLGDSNVEAAFKWTLEITKWQSIDVINYRRAIGGEYEARFNAPARSLVYIYCATAGIGKSKCVWPFVAPSRAIPVLLFFFSTASRYFIQWHFTRALLAPFDIAVSLHKIQGLHKTTLRAPSSPPSSYTAESRTFLNMAEKPMLRP